MTTNESATAASAEAELASPQEPAAPRVFLAEDDREMRELLTFALQRDGYDVVEAEDGGHLMDLLAAAMGCGGAFDVDVIVSDVRMPGITGLRALAMLREYDQTTPVVLITAFGDEATHADAYRLGATLVLDKPFELEVFQQAVRRLALVKGGSA